MVRPIKVEAGEWDEEVTNLIEKAKEIDIRLQKATTETDNSEMRSIGGALLIIILTNNYPIPPKMSARPQKQAVNRYDSYRLTRTMTVARPALT